MVCCPNPCRRWIVAATCILVSSGCLSRDQVFLAEPNPLRVNNLLTCVPPLDPNCHGYRPTTWTPMSPQCNGYSPDLVSEPVSEPIPLPPAAPQVGPQATPQMPQTAPRALPERVVPREVPQPVTQLQPPPKPAVMYAAMPVPAASGAVERASWSSVVETQQGNALAPVVSAGWIGVVADLGEREDPPSPPLVKGGARWGARCEDTVQDAVRNTGSSAPGRMQRQWY